MGLGDFLHGVGDGIVGGVESAVGGVVHAGQSIGHDIKELPTTAKHLGVAAEKLGEGALWTINPEHYGDIARGAWSAEQFVQHNPGEVWDTGFEIGRQVLKDQLKPQNIAINAGLLALTVATGGAAAPALAAKLGLGAKAVEGAVEGLEAVKTGESVVEGAKAVETGVEAVKAGSTASETIKGADTAAQALSYGERQTEAASKLGRLDSFLNGTKYGTGETKLTTKILHPFETATQGIRDTAAEKILAGAGEETPGFIRQAAAAVVQGNTGSAPIRLAGQSEDVAKLQMMMWRGRSIAGRTIGYAQKAGTAQLGLEAVTNPAAFALSEAKKVNPQTVEKVATTVATDPNVQQEAQKQALSHLDGQFYGDKGGGGGGGEPPRTRTGGNGDGDGEEPFGSVAPQLPQSTVESARPTFGQRAQPGIPNDPNDDPGQPARPMTSATVSTTYMEPTNTTYINGRGKTTPTRRAQTARRRPAKALINPSSWDSVWQQPSREALGGIGMGYDWRRFIPAKMDRGTWQLPKKRGPSDTDNPQATTQSSSVTAPPEGGVAAMVPANPVITPSTSEMYATAEPPAQENTLVSPPKRVFMPLSQPQKQTPVSV